MIVISAAFQSARLLSTTVNTASKVHFNALRGLTQPCLTAYCTQRNIFTIQAFCQALPISVYFCKECLRSDLSRKTAASVLQECTRLCQINTAQRARTLLHSMPDHCCTACQITAAQHARSLLHRMLASKVPVNPACCCCMRFNVKLLCLHTSMTKRR